MKKIILFLFFTVSLFAQSASYSPQTAISFANSGAVDAFGRLRTVSTYKTLLDASNQYTASRTIFEDSLVGTADTNHVFNESSVYMLTGGTAVGAKAIRQTRNYFRYQPGKSLLIIATVTPGTPKTGTRKRWGYFDADNGIFFQLSGDTLSIVKRSKSSGTIIDSVIRQSNWNTDKLDGTGSSAINLQSGLSRSNIYWIDIEWLGVGRVRAGIYSPRGMPIVAHEFQNANLSPNVYISTANLPVRYEVENYYGTASAVDTLKQICATVVSEGGQDIADARTFCADNDSIPITTSTRRAILSIRPKLTLAGYPNREFIDLLHYEIYSSVASFYQIIYDGTLGGTPVWSDVNTSKSGFERDVSGTTVTGGIVIESGYISGASKSSSVKEGVLSSKYPLTLNMAGTIPKMITIAVKPLTGSGDFNGHFQWNEQR